MFEKKIDIQEDKIVVQITCKKRKFATEEKIRWCLDPITLLPEQYKNNLTLVSKPDKIVSNVVDEVKYITTGTWVYEIENRQDNQKAVKSTNTRRRSRKSSKEN